MLSDKSGSTKHFAVVNQTGLCTQQCMYVLELIKYIFTENYLAMDDF